MPSNIHIDKFEYSGPMGFTILKVPIKANGPIEVVAECDSRCDAEQIMKEVQATDAAGGFEYLLEAPPSYSRNSAPDLKGIDKYGS